MVLVVGALALIGPPRAAASSVERVLVYDGSLVVVSVAGERVALPGTEGAAEATPSPDGRWVAFTRQGASRSGGSGPYENVDLFIVPTDGSAAPRLLTADTADNFGSPVWSPDSRSIGFTTTSVFFLRTPASWHRAGILDIDSGDRQVLPVGDSAMVHAWSPSGRVLVSTPSLATTAADGSDLRAWPSHAGAGEWSPDGSKFAWTAPAGDGTCELRVGDAEVHVDHGLQRLPCSARWSWAADSTAIVYSDGDAHIVTLAGVRATITDTGRESSAAMSPSGSLVATTSDRDRSLIDGGTRHVAERYGLRDPQPRVFVMSPSGEDQRPIADGVLIGFLAAS